MFIESNSQTVGSYRRVCVLPHAKAPQGFVPHSTIHLKRLGLSTSLKVLLGHIDRVYIVLDSNL